MRVPNIVKFLLPLFFFIVLTGFYLRPMFSGLILLPIDLLITNVTPWNLAGTILVKNTFMQDSIVQMYPWKAVTFGAIKTFSIPFWNPYQLTGIPFMASLKPMVFYPFTMILSFLPQVWAWNSLLFLQVFLALVFAYQLGRELAIDVLPSILVAIAFSLNSLMMAVLEFGSEGHVLLWVPLMLYCVKKYFDTKKGVALIVLGVAIAASMLAGHLQYFSYGFLALVSFIFWYGYHVHARIVDYVFLFLASLCGVGLSALQLLPFLELYQASYRSGAVGGKFFTEGLHIPFYFLRFLAPDFFGNPVTKDEASNYIEYSGYFGSIALFFALYALVYVRKNSLANYFKIIFLASLALSVKGIGNILLALHLPMLTSGAGNRILSLVYLSGAMLAGYGMMDFFRDSKKRKDLAILVFFLVMFALLPAELFAFNLFTGSPLHVTNLRFAFIIAALFTVLLLLSHARKFKNVLTTAILSLAIVALAFLDLYRLGYRFLTFSNAKFLYPDVPVTRFVREETKTNLGRVYGLTEPEIATLLRVPAIESYNPMNLRRTRIFLDTVLHRKAGAVGLTSKETLETTDVYAKKQAFDMLGVSYVATPSETDPSLRYFGTVAFQGSFTPVYKDQTHIVYRNGDVFPRYQLFYDAISVKTEQEALQKISDPSIDLKKTLIVESDPPIALHVGTGSATLTTFATDALSFSIQSDTPALLYLSDANFAGWKATVNGKEEKIIQANYAFRAVAVPEGKSTVTFAYKPTSFRQGLIISAVAGAILLLIGVARQLFPSKL